MSGALSGISVVDISTSPAGAWCARLLAGYGADVVAIDLNNEAAALRPGPFDSTGESIPWAYWSAGKRPLRLDPGSKAGRSELLAIVKAADVLVTTGTPRELAAFGLSYATLESPSLVMAHVTPWGFEGSMAEAPGPDLLVAARSGWAYINGLADRTPLQPVSWQPSYCAGVAACIAVLAALHQRNETGLGQEVDVSANEAMLASFAPAFLIGQYSGTPAGRKAVADMLAGPVPVADGYFSLTLSRGHFWRDAMSALGLPDLAEDERWDAAWYRQAHKDQYVDRVQEKMAAWEKMALFDELAARRVVAGPVLTMAELAENEHLQARDFWERDRGGRVWPGAPARLSRTPWRSAAEEPTADLRPVERKAAANPSRADASSPPLAGIQAIVLTQAWAGTFCTELIGLLGADVVQVESWQRLDSWRGGLKGPIPDGLKHIPTAQHPWNCNALYNSVNLNKRSVTLNLQDERGRDVFRRLAKHADIIAENFSPRVLGNLDIGYETLSAINPGVILCSLSAYGHDGPWANIPGIGGTIEPTSGMSELLGYEGGPPMNSGQMYPDPVAGMYGVTAILAALHHRDRTGEGQYIDLSMQEANLANIGDVALEYLRNGTQRPRLGNRNLDMAPHGIYPCATENEWVAIAARNDAEFANLARLIGIVSPGAYASVESRQANADALDAAIESWTRRHEQGDAVRLLEQACVPVAPVLNGHQVAREELLRERGMLVSVSHPEVGETLQLASPFHFSMAQPAVVRPAPRLGEHCFEVFQQFLGMTTDEYQELVRAGITGTEPAASEA